MAVYFYGCITLDGYLAAKGHGLDWLYDTGSPEETSYDEFYSRMDLVLMGRRTFQEIEKTGNPASVYAEGSHAPVPAGNRPAVRAVCGAGVWQEMTGAVHLQLFSLRCTAEKDMLY